MRYRLRFIYQFALLAAVALLAVIGLGVFDLNDRAHTDEIIREQDQLLEVKRDLGRIELEILNARLAETQMLSRRNLLLYDEYVAAMDRVSYLIEALHKTLSEKDIDHSLQVLDRTSERYRSSVKKILGVQRNMGLGEDTGVLVQMRALQDEIQAQFQQFRQLSDSQHVFQLSRMLLLERDFSNSLNMKLADQLLVEVKKLQDDISQRNLDRGNRDGVEANLRRYDQLVTQLVSSTVELELATAETALQFKRISPVILRCQEAVDVLVEANTGRLLEQRQQSFWRTVAVFSAALLLIAFLMVLQIRSARQLALRLDLLAEGMREIAEGNFMKVTDLPQGRDEVGQLALTFKTMATQIQKQILTIQQEREKAEIANRVKSQFLATMSHEIRTPLNAVMGMLDLLQHTELEDEQREYVSTGYTAARSLLELLHGILDLSRLEAEKLSLEKEPFSLQAVIGQTVSLYGPMAREKGLVFEHFADRKIPAKLLGDAGRIRQILVNIVGNAIKFTEQGRVKLAVQRVDSEHEGVELHFSIQDTGPGIPAELHEKIFRPFTQGDESLTRTHAGSGLGLSICARLIELMGGRIGVESEAGQGASFSFVITLEEANEQSVGPATAQGVRAEMSSLGQEMPLAILLVDDIETNLTAAVRFFAAMGYDIDVANNGFEAVERVQLRSYDLVFIDLQMPGMGGEEAAGLIRQTSENPPHIIAVDSIGQNEGREKIARVPIDDFLTKPFKQNDLYDMVIKWGGLSLQREK